MASRLLVYALGGGFGHLTRACALAHAAPREMQVRVLTNSPYATIVKHAMPDLDIVALDPAMRVEEGRVEVLREIASAAADGFIVDTFPRGLGGELVDIVASFKGLKVFVQRDLNPHYVAKYHLNGFIAASYDLVLDAGDSMSDGLGPFPQTVVTAPWLIRERGELLPRERARRLLGLLDVERPCIAVCAAGNREELAWYGAVVCGLVAAAECDVRCMAPERPDGCPAECWVQYWPAMDLYSAVDVLIGGAGYNTVYEASACGVPLVARAWPRKYDRQNLRARRATRVVNEPREAVDAALELARSGARNGSQFGNGTTEAMAEIVDRLKHVTQGKLQ